MKMRLRPIRVFCLHHVCAEFDAESMNACDWMEIGEFKEKVQTMRQDGVEFISLREAYRHICEDWIRGKKYAVMTFDDGYSSLKEILPWLEEQKIPVTLFINAKYLDGRSYRKNPKERYLTRDELLGLTSSLIEIGNHGWAHIETSEMTQQAFIDSVMLSEEFLIKLSNYIPFYAFPYGRGTKDAMKILEARNLIPVLVTGKANYNNPNDIDRELFSK